MAKEMREKYPDWIIFGGLEKECLNSGNAHMIRPEIVEQFETMAAFQMFEKAPQAQTQASFRHECHCPHRQKLQLTRRA